MAHFRNTRSASTTVLLAEDESLIRMMVTDALIAAGFVVIEAGHAQAALAVLRSKAAEIHVLFTDIHMPGPMNGLQLAHHTRQHWPHVAALIVSGQAKPHADDLPIGARFLSKPYEPDQVIEHIRELAAIR